MRRILALLAIPAAGVAAAALIPAGSSAATGTFAHSAPFIGAVNGVADDAPVYVHETSPGSGVCTLSIHGAIANQTWSVSSGAGGSGVTGSIGDSQSIGAQFAEDAAHLQSNFTTSGQVKAIPAGVRLPCEGVGTAVFTSSGTRNATPDRVGVEYVNVGS